MQCWSRAPGRRRDRAKFGDAELVKVGDVDLAAAEKSAARVNQLLGREIARPVKVDVTDESGLVAVLEDVDAFLSAVPYWFNPGIARAAIKARASMCDLGGNTGLVFEQLKLDREAEAAGISMVPDCGQVPGMGTSWQPTPKLFDQRRDLYLGRGHRRNRARLQLLPDL